MARLGCEKVMGGNLAWGGADFPLGGMYWIVWIVFRVIFIQSTPQIYTAVYVLYCICSFIAFCIKLNMTFCSSYRKLYVPIPHPRGTQIYA